MTSEALKYIIQLLFLGSLSYKNLHHYSADNLTVHSLLIQN